MSGFLWFSENKKKRIKVVSMCDANILFFISTKHQFIYRSIRARKRILDRIYHCKMHPPKKTQQKTNRKNTRMNDMTEACVATDILVNS